MTKPSLGHGCSIDVDKLVESRLLLQANSGGGKSWAIRRLLEQTYGRVQHIVLDSEGEFHTLREKFDYVLAGPKGDCPADIKSAALLARRLLELNVSAIVDIYELGSSKRLFVRRFLESLISVGRDLWHPALVVVDEAHVFAPEAGQSESASAVIDLMTLGRKRGFCGVLATQRISKLHKDAAAEANCKMIGRSALDIDMKRAAAEIGFTTREDTLSLRTLKAGEFFVFGPAFSDEVKQIKVGDVQTTHLRAGQRAAPPTPPSAKVKKILGQLADLPHEAEEEARSIQEWRSKVKQLEAELRKAKAAHSATAEKITIKTIEKPIIQDSQLKRIEGLEVKLGKASAQALEGAKLLNEGMAFLKNFRVSEIPKAKVYRPNGKTEHEQIQEWDLQRKKMFPQIKSQPTSYSASNDLPKGEMAILSALIQYDHGLDLDQITVITGYKATSRYEYLRRLKERGFVEERSGRPHATDLARNMFPQVKPLPTGIELREWQLSRLPKGERVLLEKLIEAYPSAIDFATLEELTGYKTTSRYEYLRRLSARELVVEEDRGAVKASPTLFEVT